MEEKNDNNIWKDWKEKYKILECVVAKMPVPRAQISIDTGLSEYAISIAQLENSGLIELTDNFFRATSAGISVYLSLQSTKLSIESTELSRETNRLAEKATYYAITAAIIATLTMIIEIIALYRCH